MSKAKLLQTNFTAGEVSPLMLGRVDTTKYQNGAARLTNMLVKPTGGLWYRQGSYYMGEVKYSAKKTIIHEFEFSDIQTYQLEIGDLYIRVWYDGGFVETSPGSGLPLEVTTVYREQDLAQLQFAQSADVMYITHPLYMPKKLQRLGANSWSIVAIDPQDGPYLGNNTDTSILTVSNYTSVAIATATTAIFTLPASLKTITGLAAGSGTKIRLTITGHGYSTGNILSITGIEEKHPPLNMYSQTNYPYGNGLYVITVIDANHVDLDASIYSSGFTYRITGPANAQLFVDRYVEYRYNNTWHLAHITSVIDTFNANVSVIQNVKNDITKLGAKLTYAGSTVTSDKAGSFTSDDIGAYIRLTDGSWHQITAFLTDLTVTATAAFTLAAYTYPTTVVTVSTPIVTASISSSKVTQFVSTDIGRVLRLNFGGKQPWFQITALITTQTVAVNVFGLIPVDSNSINAFYNNGATDVWKFGAWSDTTGYPRAVCLHEQRLWFGGSVTEPQTLWGSESSDYESFAPSLYDSTVIDSSAISYTFASNKANPVIWLESGSTLLIGTTGSELIVKASSSSATSITPTNISITPQSHNGVLVNSRPVHAGISTLFIQRAGRKLIELQYSFQQDVFMGRNLCVVNDQILRRGGSAVGIAYQREPNNVIWAVLADGTMAALTYEAEQQVAAWHQHILGGDGKVESICATNSTAGTEDLLYMIVKRTINGTTKRYIEYFTADFYPVDVTSRSDMYFLDGGLKYSGAPTTSITGLTHLLNETVSVVADGVYIGEKVISNAGVLTLSTAASKVSVGYKYRGLVQLLPLDGGTNGTAVGKVKRVGRTLLRLLNSLSFKVGMKINLLDTVKITDDTGVTPSNEFFTGDKVVNLSQSYELTSTPFIVQDNPYPLILLAVGPDTEVTT